MSECHYRLEADVTFDELVKAQVRAALESKTYRRQRRMIQAVVIAMVVYSIFSTTVPRTATYDFGHNVIQWFIAIVFLTAAVFGSGPFYDWSMRRSIRRQLQEVYGTEDTVFPSEMELRDDTLWTKNTKFEISLPWSQCTVVSDAGDGIELRFGVPLVLVYNRYFPTAEERSRFFEKARALAGVPNERSGHS
jgi:hypothetical protein